MGPALISNRVCTRPIVFQGNCSFFLTHGSSFRTLLLDLDKWTGGNRLKCFGRTYRGSSLRERGKAPISMGPACAHVTYYWLLRTERRCRVIPPPLSLHVHRPIMATSLLLT